MASGPNIRALIEKARPNPTGRPRSQVRRLLEAEYDSLVSNPPDWTKLAKDLSAHGMRVTGPALKSMFARIRASRRGALVSRPGPARQMAPAPTDEPFEIRSIKPKEPQ